MERAQRREGASKEAYFIGKKRVDKKPAMDYIHCT
jgi:hypothetical protein